MTFAFEFGDAIVEPIVQRLLHMLIDERQQPIRMLVVVIFVVLRRLVVTQWLSESFKWTDLIVAVVIIAGDADARLFFLGFDVNGQTINRLRQWINSNVCVGVDTNESLVSRYGEQRVQAKSEKSDCQ